LIGKLVCITKFANIIRKQSGGEDCAEGILLERKPVLGRIPVWIRIYKDIGRGCRSAMANQNGQETGNCRYSQGNPQGNSPFLDPTIALNCRKNVVNLYGCEILFIAEIIKYQAVR
jgi:hypothetical protein